MSPTARKPPDRSSPLVIGNTSVQPGEARDLRLKVSETYTGTDVSIPIRVMRGRKPGPAVFVSAAIHGDELNGTGIIHEIMFTRPWKLVRGTLILAPVVNVFGFESNERYLPDRRDLNRSFPGGPKGSLARRIASIFMREVVQQCDYGIDLHSAGSPRTNFPNIRAQVGIPAVSRIATAFGCELIVDTRGPAGSLRNAACRAGCATIVLEAGEPYKVEPPVQSMGLQGIQNVLIELKMLRGRPLRPAYQMTVARTRWVRAQLGGILRFHVVPGDTIEKGQPIATNYSILGKEQNVLESPLDGVIFGMITMPKVKPGEPVCHIAVPTRPIAAIRKALARMPSSSSYFKLRNHMAAGIPLAGD